MVEPPCEVAVQTLSRLGLFYGFVAIAGHSGFFNRRAETAEKTCPQYRMYLRICCENYGFIDDCPSDKLFAGKG